jgi:glycogen(starch) synthase
VRVPLHRADAAVLPSHYEQFGLVALEAAAAGTPLVAANIGGLGEAVIDGQTGMLWPPRDVARLAAAVRTVRDDPAAAQRRAQPPANGSPPTHALPER